MLMLAACGGQKVNLPLEGTQWKLMEMDGKANPAFTAEPDTFNFTLDPSRMMVYGVGACNRLFGPYELEGKDELDIERLASTMMACPNMDLETSVLQSMDQVRSVKAGKDENEMLLVDQDGNVLLVLERN